MIQFNEDKTLKCISCDHPGCATPAPSLDDIRAAFGLQGLDWECCGGTHLCPVHADPVAIRAREDERIARQQAMPAGGRGDG